METPCDIPVEVYNENTGKMETHFQCPYEDMGYASGDMCRVCCGLGVDE